MKKKLWVTVVLVIVLAAVLALGGFYFLKNKGNGVQFKTAKTVRGDLRAVVTATGTVSAVTTVQVGTQVSGTIKELFVDFNSSVKKGQLLARIDPTLSEAKVAQARANLQAALANVEKAEASLADANRTLERNKTLFAGNYIARSDLDTADTNRATALAQLSVAKAQVEQQKAALTQEETTLHYTRILSPVDGTIISRNVDIGQTVAASFQTPTLFSIAQDLTRMQIDTNVDEADIGRIKVGQQVQFTVDAYPDTTFPGRVSEIRNAPTTISNVVTYDVVVRVSNPELQLKPGMTANVSIITAQEKGALKIPNAALRFKWQPTGTGSASARGETGRGEAGAGNRQINRPANGGTTPGVWILEGKNPRRAPLTLGISDGSDTTVLSGALQEGDRVIIDTNGSEKKTGQQGGGPPGPFR
jgi:HlyD family secretion protein